MTTDNLMGRNITAANSTYKKLAVQYSADTFVVNQTLVLRINICGKNRQLLVAANRYASPYFSTRQRPTVLTLNGQSNEK